jgi:hypothetical protein
LERGQVSTVVDTQEQVEFAFTRNRPLANGNEPPARALASASARRVSRMGQVIGPSRPSTLRERWPWPTPRPSKPVSSHPPSGRGYLLGDDRALACCEPARRVAPTARCGLSDACSESASRARRSRCPHGVGLP